MSSTAASAAQGLGPIVGDLRRWLFSGKPWRVALFLVLSFPIGAFWFFLIVATIVVGVCLAITWVGIPILALAVALWLTGARLERWRIRAFFGRSIPAPYRPRPQGRWRHRAGAIVRDPAVWRDLIYLLLLLPVGMAEIVITWVGLTTTFLMITAPFHYWTDKAGLSPLFETSLLRNINTFPEALFLAPVGLILAPVVLFFIGAIGWLHVILAQALLGPDDSAELAQRVDVLTRTRSGVVDAMLVERRRIERDLHDGAQQRLVALAMELGMAKEKMKTDPEAASELIAASHEEAKRVLSELRDFVRGIHPAVLTDRGLDPAISALASRCPVPVNVDVALNERLPDVVESTAYFVVAEALTNVAKHSGATAAQVIVYRDGDWLIVEVSDNGRGGASFAEGSGLVGLDERLAALDGRFTVVSPPEGGTRIRAEMPCGS
jgi:signal transduction histidine kinase